jgi:hypothetical protein
MQAGETFFLFDDGHLCVILKTFGDGSVVYCHLTTMRSRSDKTFVIQAGAHEFVTNDSIFRYDQAQHCEAGTEQLEAFKRTVERGKKYPPFAPDLLAKSVDGALRSPQTPPKIKKLLS